MKNRTMFLSAFAALTLLGAGARAADRPDSWITTKVKSELAAHKDVSATHTHVTTEDGVVTLTGNAKTTAEKEKTAEIAGQVEGVKNVDNRLVVIASKGHTRAEKEGEGSLMIDKGDDALITGKVKHALSSNAETKALKPEVHTKDGAVTLTGTAASDSQKELAEKVTKKVHGVRSVTNDLEVK